MIRLTTALLLFSALPASALSTAPNIAPREIRQETEAEKEQEAARLLYLASGRVLRARTRLLNGQWEYKRGREWIALDPGSVTKSAKERTLLAEAKKRSKKLKRGSLESRASHAEWLNQVGLYQESIQELENILTKDPDQEWALRLLSEGPTLASLPTADNAQAKESRVELLRYGAKGGAVARELTTRELSNLEDKASLREDLKRELESTSVRRRAFGAHALRRLFPGEEIKRLVMRSVLDSSANVRMNCAYALKSAGDPAVALPLLRGLASSRVEVRTNSAEALGYMQFPETVEPLVNHYVALTALQGGGTGSVPRANIFVGKQIAYIQDFDVEVAQFQAVADPQVNILIEGSVLEGRVIGVRNSQLVYERSAVRGALRKLTGADPGDKPSHWQKWWEENKPRYRPTGGRTESR